MLGDIRGMWPLTESAGGSGAILDRSIQAGKLTSFGSPTFAVTGIRGTSITFDQTNSDYLCTETGVANGSCDDDGNFDTTAGSFSVGAWVNRSTGGSDADTIIAKYGNSANPDQAFSLFLSATNVPTLRTVNGSTTTDAVGPAFSNAMWHHVVGVFDNTNNMQYVYVDGELAGSAAQTSNTTTQGRANPINPEGLIRG